MQRLWRTARPLFTIGPIVGLLILLPAITAMAAGVTSFTLINADTNTPIAGFDPMPAGAVIDLGKLSTKRLNIRANTSPTTVGSVKFGLNTQTTYRIENAAPYALAGDTNADYQAWTPALGQYSLTATPYSSSYAKGTAGTPLKITFTVASSTDTSTTSSSTTSSTSTTTSTSTTSSSSTQAVQSFTLINADTNAPIAGFDPMPAGAVVDLATVPTLRLNIRANTSPATVGSVKFGLDTKTSYRIENGAPYALAGDTNGDYHGWTPTLGQHSLTATPYTSSNAKGTAGTPLKITFTVTSSALASSTTAGPTVVSLHGDRFYINDVITYRGSAAEGLLMNVRMVNTVFEDTNRTSFNPETNTDEFIAAMRDYVAHGIRAFTVGLQGGYPGYEGAVNTAFRSDGSLKSTYLARVKRVIQAADSYGATIILGLYYFKQDQHLANATAVKNGVVNVMKWITAEGFGNVVVEIANEYPHGWYDHEIIRTNSGMASLIRLAKATAPHLYVSASGSGTARIAAEVADASDFILIHTNEIDNSQMADRINALKSYGKPIVINEHSPDVSDRTAAEAARIAVQNGASWGLMRWANQSYPFEFRGAADAPETYEVIWSLTGH